MSKENQKETKKLSLNIISKYRSPIYGFAILWIVFFHAFAINKIDYSFGIPALKFLKIINAGNVGVDIFLFLSGICLYFSYYKNPNSYEFLKKRLIRIVLPVWIINGAYWFIRFVLIQHGGLSAFVSRMLLLRFWETGDQAIWFVSCILVLYFLYPYIYQFLFQENSSNRKIIMRGILLMMLTYLAIISFSRVNSSLYNSVEIALTRFPVFIFGCIMGKFIFEDTKVPFYWHFIAILGVIVFFIICYLKPLSKMQMRFFYLVGGVSLAYTLAFLFSFIDSLCKKYKSYFLRFLSKVGEFSLELYLSHIMINQVYQMLPFYEIGNFWKYLIVIGLSILVAWVAYLFSNFIKKWIVRNEGIQHEKDKKIIST